MQPVGHVPCESMQMSAGQTFTVNQAAACMFTLGAVMTNFASSGGNSSVNVTSATGCAWTATSNDGWISVTSGTPGNGSGTVVLSVAANSGAARTGTVIIAGQTFTVNQAAACSYTLGTGFASLSAAGGSSSVSVTSATGAPVAGPMVSPSHMTRRPRTMVPRGKPVTVTPS